MSRLEHSDQELNLNGKMLIAMPGMGDPRFVHSVVFMCAHSDDGAMGLIVNKPVGEMQLSDLLEQLSITKTPDAEDIQLHFGGPVEGGRGFVLHSTEYRSGASTVPVTDDIGMTATLDILEDMANGKGPEKTLMALGYSGWSAGQLEGEIAENGWLICDASTETVFDTEDTEKWVAALKTIGVDALSLSASAGHA